jgi:hypothetical protein
MKWQKVSHEDKKIEKVQICQNAPRPLIQESRDFIGHFLKVMTRAEKGAIGIIFDIGYNIYDIANFVFKSYFFFIFFSPQKVIHLFFRCLL